MRLFRKYSYVNRKSYNLNELALANMEALAQSETSEEFTNATCCIACWDNHSCSGCDGKTYSYAHKK